MTRNLLNTINIDVPAAVVDDTVAFWSAALGTSPLRTKMPQYTILENAAEPNRLVIQTIEEGPASVHFDIHTDDLDTEIDRLVALGATLVDGHWKDHPRRVGRHPRPGGQRVLPRRRDQPTPRAAGPR